MEPEPRYRLVKPKLLRELMARTGTGRSVSTRELAAAVGVPHGTIDNLLRGIVRTQPSAVAHDMARFIGVDLLILWAPTGRSVSQEDALPPHVAVLS